MKLQEAVEYAKARKRVAQEQDARRRLQRHLRRRKRRLLAAFLNDASWEYDPAVGGLTTTHAGFHLQFHLVHGYEMSWWQIEQVPPDPRMWPPTSVGRGIDRLEDLEVLPDDNP